MKRHLPPIDRECTFRDNSIKARLYLLFFFLFLSAAGYAQQNTIKGTVTDGKGVTLIGVSVKVKNTQLGVTTDANVSLRSMYPTKM
ncbi:carboxypeptidase-like regulatory domain-containing protein [Pedobacter hartonius]|uniref:CarboxypepD_reg-like domain-containing protein n=1 Tax=Pedobacter hartonius TaxID=425514 RepID=A0A1H4H8I8_9SPHI|nr:carboxypeptidase-like regulatory domain-containing protein [Pedobacter hartonius]SEB17951.1 hypothetical protein SAMN05443550_11439 [Pedobacter hartonius]